MSDAKDTEAALQKANDRLKRKLARAKSRLEESQKLIEDLKKANSDMKEELEAVKAVVEVYDKHRPQAGEKKKAGVDESESDDEDFEDDLEQFDKTNARDDSHIQRSTKPKNVADKLAMDLIRTSSPAASQTTPKSSQSSADLPSQPQNGARAAHVRLYSDSTNKNSTQISSVQPIRGEDSDSNLTGRSKEPFKRPSPANRRPDVPKATTSGGIARKYNTSRDIGISLSLQDQIELYGDRNSSRSTFQPDLNPRTPRSSTDTASHRNTMSPSNSSASVSSTTSITQSQPSTVKRAPSKPDPLPAATDDASDGRLPAVSTGTPSEPQLVHRDQPKIFDENTVRDILCGLSITCNRTFNDDLLVPADYSYSYQFKVRRVPQQLLKFKDFAPKVFQQIRQFWGVDNNELMHSFGYDNLDAIRGEGKSGAFFIFTRDKRFILKTATGPERDFLWEMLPYYFLYIRKNPNTLLPRFYGVYSMKHEGIGGMVRFVVMNNVFATPSPLNEVYDLKGSTLGRSSGEDVPKGSLLKDLDIKRKFHLPDPEVAERFLEQLQADSQFLAQHNVMDYSLLVGVHYDNDEGKEKTRKKLVEWTRYYAEDSTFKSLFQSDGSGMAGWNEDTKTREVYFIGIIDILQKYTPKKKIEHFFKSIPYKANTVSVVEPSFYARRFFNFIKGVSAASSLVVSDAPSRLQAELAACAQDGDVLSGRDSQDGPEETSEGDSHSQSQSSPRASGSFGKVLAQPVSRTGSTGSAGRRSASNSSRDLVHKDEATTLTTSSSRDISSSGRDKKKSKNASTPKESTPEPSLAESHSAHSIPEPEAEKPAKKPKSKRPKQEAELEPVAEEEVQAPVEEEPKADTKEKKKKRKKDASEAAHEETAAETAAAVEETVVTTAEEVDPAEEARRKEKKDKKKKDKEALKAQEATEKPKKSKVPSQ